jgi:hypothetical protein
MLCLVSLARRWRSKERMRYWVRERSVWRMESLRFSVGLWVLVLVMPLLLPPLKLAGSYDDAVRSSMISIYR